MSLRVNYFLTDYRYTTSKVGTLKYKKYRVLVSVSAIIVSGIDDTQNKVSVSLSVSAIMVSSRTAKCIFRIIMSNLVLLMHIISPPH